MSDKQAKREREAKCANEDVELLLTDLEKLECGQPTLSRDQLQAAVKDLAEMVDGYLTFSAFDFLSCADGESESNFTCPTSPWDWSTEPSLSVYDKHVELYDQFLDGVFSNKKPSIESNLSNTVVDLITAHRVSGFYMGILVGAKMTVRPRKKCTNLGRGCSR